jgi:hypothetical protein
MKRKTQAKTHPKIKAKADGKITMPIMKLRWLAAFGPIFGSKVVT